MHETLRHIKQDFRTMMNGVASTSMREKGLAYKVNFGIELPRLQAYADELRAATRTTDNRQQTGVSTLQDKSPLLSLYSLALALWNEPIRECRLLAGMLMPPAEMDEQTAELWVEQMQWKEEAECTVMHLLQHLPYASTLAFRWIADERPMHRLTGWLLMTRLFMQGMEPTQRDADEMLDQAAAEIGNDNDPQVREPLLSGLKNACRLATYKAILKYMDLSPTASARGEELLQKFNL